MTFHHGSTSLFSLAALLTCGPVWAVDQVPVPKLNKAPFADLIRQESVKTDLPPDIVDAVVAIESGYDPTRIGNVGEIGLMQVRPATASMLGFKGSTAELAKPEINIHFGVMYLAEAWRQADRDLCRTLMKYRAGHGNESMSPLSIQYCGRAIAHLALNGSHYASSIIPPASAAPSSAIARISNASAIPKINIHLKGQAFWAQHNAHVKALTARVERRWRQMANR